MERPLPPTTTTSPGAGHVHGRPAALAGVALSAAAVLVFEIVLTRVFAVTQFYHFAFLTVSLALLGYGASGSALTASPRLGRGGPKRWALLAAAQSVTTLVGYAVANAVPFDSFSIGWDPVQTLYLAVSYLALSVPFFFGGLVIGTLLSGRDQPQQIPSHHVYSAGLLGSGIGALVALGGLGFVGGVGMVAVAAALAAAGAAAFALASAERSRRMAATTALLTALMLALAVAPPGFLDLRLSPYKALSAVLRFPDTEVVSTRWNAASRVDHVRSTSIRSMPGLSYAYTGSVPPQDGVTFDGDDLSPVPAIDPKRADFAPFMLNSLAFSLRPGGDVLVLDPRGGLDVLVALASGFGSVTAVEPNELAITAAYETPGNAYADPRVRLVVAEPRSFIERSTDLFDVVDLALTTPYRPVTSGAYSLAEDYRLTIEAFDAYLQRLAPGGILTVMRWVQVPPSEEIRLVALAAEAVRRTGADPAASVVVLRGYSTALVLVKPDGFTPVELAAVAAFAEERRFDLVSAPGLEPEGANRFNVLPSDDYYPLAASLLAGGHPGAVYDGHRFDIAPPTDDRPFFGHYFKWDQASEVFDTLGRTWQPFGGAGYFVLLALLALAVVASAALILAPLWFSRAGRRAGGGAGRRGLRLWTAGYFGLLGIAFLFVEIPLIQRYILLLGRPTTALAVVLFGLLAASGAGSLASRWVPWRRGAVALTVLAAAYPFLITLLTRAVLPMPLSVRVAVGALALTPLGFLMGTMFPRGLARLEEEAPALVPWAWGINGTLSVVSAVTAALVALSSGFTLVLLLGAGCYAACVPLARSATPTDRG